MATILSKPRIWNIRVVESAANTPTCKGKNVPFYGKNGLYIGIAIHKIVFDPDSPSPNEAIPQGAEASVNCELSTKADALGMNSNGFIAKAVERKFRVGGDAGNYNQNSNRHALDPLIHVFDPPLFLFTRKLFGHVDGFANQTAEGVRIQVIYSMVKYDNLLEILDILTGSGSI